MSRRNKKRIDYGSFGDDDLDDDFAEFTPPASKKAKKTDISKDNDNKLKKKKTQQNAVKDQKMPAKSRQSIDEKIFERELQVAMEMSISESQDSPKEEDAANKEKTELEMPLLRPEVSELETDKQCENPVLPVQNSNKSKTGLNEEEIVVLETDIVEEPKGRRRAATKKVMIDDSGDDDSDAGSDFQINGAVDNESESSDSDFNGDDDYDSDFDSGKKKKKQKENVKKKTTPKAKKEVTSKSKTKTVLQPKSSVTTNKASPVTGRGGKVATKTSVKTTPVVQRSSLSSPIPRWNPPGLAQNKAPESNGMGIKSPSSGLRLGLSRNIRLKPLHPKLKVQH